MNIHSLKFKILGILMLCTLLPLAAATQLLSFYAEKNTLLQAEDNISLTMDAQIESMENVLKSLEEMQQDMKHDQIIYEFANQIREMEFDRRQEYCRKIFLQLKYYQEKISAIRLTNYVHSVYLYIPNQRILFASDQTYFENCAAENVDFIELYKEKGKEALNSWISTVPVNYETIHYIDSWDKHDRLISYCDIILNEDDKVIAVFALNLKPEFLNLYFDRIQNGGSKEIIVYEQSGNIYFGTGENLEFYQEKYKDGSIKYLNASEEILGDEKLVVSRASAYTTWVFVTFASRKKLLKDIDSIRALMYKIVFVSGIVACVIAFALFESLYKPLKKLKNHMREVRHGNLKIRIHEDCKDEYAEVYSGFNRMLDELNKTMDNLETEKILNKEAKIRLLQEQINPHFLYNTLDTIFSMAKISGENVIAKMVFSLSKFFRINLSDGKDVVTLREAVNLTENYLVIQEIRFPDRFQCHRNIPEKLMGYLVPKFLLQPFVENSIIHGLESCAHNGALYIEGRKEAGDLYFIIKDNGMGIGKEELLSIQEELAENTTGARQHFAITNISSLIKLKYGQEYGVEIFSEWGYGTEVRIKIPAVEE